MRLRVVNPWAYLNWLVFPLIFAAVGLFVLTSTGYTRVAYGVLGGGIIGFWASHTWTAATRFRTKGAGGRSSRSSPCPRRSS